MTKTVQNAVEVARDLPPEVQKEIALIVAIAGKDEPAIPLGADEEASFAVSRAQAARGEFASDARMKAIWSKGPA